MGYVYIPDPVYRRLWSWGMSLFESLSMELLGYEVRGHSRFSVQKFEIMGYVVN